MTPRDVKTANLLATTSEEHCDIVLADFGFMLGAFRLHFEALGLQFWHMFWSLDGVWGTDAEKVTFWIHLSWGAEEPSPSPGK